MGLADQLGAVDPQGIVTGLIADQAPALAQNDSVDPQSVLNRLLRKGLDDRQRRDLQNRQRENTQPPGQPGGADFGVYGKTQDEIEQAPPADFAQFGEEAPKPEAPPSGAIATAGKAALSAPVTMTGEAMKGAARLTAPLANVSPETGAIQSDEALQMQQAPPPPAEASPLYKAGQATQKFGEGLGPTDAERAAHPIAAGIGGGVGAAGAIVGLGLLAPEAALAGGAALFGLSGGEQTYEDAKKKGADDATAGKAASLSGLANAALGTLPVANVLKPFARFMPEATGYAMNILAKAAENGIVFATIGEAQEFIGQQIAKLYDPKAGYSPNLDRLLGSLGAGAILGGGHAALAGRGKGATAGADADASAGATTGATTPAAPPPGGGGEAPHGWQSAEGGARMAGGGPEAQPSSGAAAEPFETNLNPKTRATMETQAAYYGDHSTADLKAMSDTDLKEYLRQKFFGDGSGDVEGASSALNEEDQRQEQQRDRRAEPGSQANPVELNTAADTARATAKIDPDHTPAQAEAGNAQRGHAVWNGMPIALEVGAGGTRKGLNPDTKEPWQTTHPDAYGEFKGLPPAADGMAPDVIVGPHPSAPTVFVIDEIGEDGQYRQSKSMIGFRTPADAAQSYAGISSKGMDRIGGMRAFSREEFSKFAKNGGLSKPVSEAMEQATKSAASAQPEKTGKNPEKSGTAVTPQHIAAVHKALHGAGIDPAHLDPEDIARAAQLVATHNAPPDQAFSVAVLQRLVEDGHIKREDIDNAIGPDKTASLLEPFKRPAGELPAAAPGAATGGSLAAAAGELAQGGAAPGTGKNTKPDLAEEPAGGKADGGKSGVPAAGHPESGQAAVHTGGGERATATGQGAGVEREHAGQQPAAQHQNAATTEGALTEIAHKQEWQEQVLRLAGGHDEEDIPKMSPAERDEAVEHALRRDFEEQRGELRTALAQAKIPLETVLPDVEDRAVVIMADPEFDGHPLDALEAGLAQYERDMNYVPEQLLLDLGVPQGAIDALDSTAAPQRGESATTAGAEPAETGSGKPAKERGAASGAGEGTGQKPETGAAAAGGGEPEPGAGEPAEPDHVAKEPEATTTGGGKTKRGKKAAAETKTATEAPEETPGPSASGVVQSVLDAAKKHQAIARILRRMQEGENFNDAARDNYAKLMTLLGDRKVFPTIPTGEDFDAAAAVFEKPAKKPAATAAAEEPGKAKLEDAGEKIGGARKDQWERQGLSAKDLEGMTGAEKAKHVTKENVFPRPDYVDLVENNGVNPQAAFIIKRVYDRIASTPNEGTHEEYIAALNTVRGLMAGLTTVDDVKALHAKFNQDIEAVQGKGNSWGANNRLTQERQRRSPLYVSYEDERLAKKAVEQDGFPNIEPWQRLFSVYERPTDWNQTTQTYDRVEYGLYGKGRTSVPEGITRSHATREAAVEAAKKAYEQINKGRGEGMPERPHLDSVGREGPDYRKGADVDGQKLIDEFGVRGVEFGNWAAGDERQKVVNFAYDALHDLARVLGIPPKAISLNGTLAIGFGSRGRGGPNAAAAHYEPGRLVINLTKMNGAGSLAHEWLHALDHYLGEAQKPLVAYQSAPVMASGGRKTGINYTYRSMGELSSPLRITFNAVMDKLFLRDETADEKATRIASTTQRYREGIQSWEESRARAQKALQEGKKGAKANLRQAEEQIRIWSESLARKTAESSLERKETDYYKNAVALAGKAGKDGYYARPEELLARAFESYVFDKIAQAELKSEYLVHGVEPTRFATGYKSNPYPTGKERETFNRAFDQLFNAIDTAEGKLGEKTRLVGKSHNDWTSLPEPQDEPVAEEAQVDSVVAGQSTPGQDEIAQTDEPAGTPAGKRADILADHFGNHFGDGKGFQNILAARKFAKDKGFDVDPKMVEEAIELAIVKRAHSLAVENKADPKAAFDALTKLYGLQPKLGTRTSTSVRDQAYSTPVPLGYLASKLADITPDKSVFEPSAGNGALLLEADPALTVANEINPVRAENLKSQGFNVTSKDAADLKLNKGFDVVIANPPFGPVRQEGESKIFDLSDIQPGYRATEIDHAIALRALAGMKDDGRGVLILGGLNKLASTPEQRAQGYNGQAKRRFYKALYDRYNVTDHFTVAGELYERQGAGWPVDVVVINGRGKSARGLPAVDVPRIYNSWDDLKGVLDDLSRNNARPVAEPDVGAAAGVAGPAGGHAGVRGEAVGGHGSEPAHGRPEGVPPRPVRERGGIEAGAGGDRAGHGPGERGEPVGPHPAAAAGRQGELENFDSLFDDALDSVFGSKTPEGPSGITHEQAREDGALAFSRGDDRVPPYPAEKFDPDVWKSWFEGFDNANAGAPVDETTAAPKPKRSGRDTRSTAEVAKGAAENIGKGADEAMEALVAMFGGGKTVGMGLNIDKETYEKAKPHFKKAAEGFSAGADDIGELMNRIIDRLRRIYGMTKEALAELRPYAVQFVKDVRDGLIRLGEETKRVFEREKPKHQETETEMQVAYDPRSNAGGLGTLVPKNMRTSIAESLAHVEKQVGDVDAFVAKELGYTPAQLADAMAAEQVDATALAIHNIDKGRGFIIGDQTGIGKGRVNAGIIRWAMKKGYIPIFVTEKPNLYKDMYRDLTDIGIQDMLEREPRFLMTNAGEKVPLDDTGTLVLKSAAGGAHASLLDSLDAGNFRDNHDVVFTTYNQMQTVAGKDTSRRSFLERIAPHAVLIFDESHNAGGQKITRKEKDAKENRAQFSRSLIGRTKGVLYSSATYAKRPDVMDLYAATDMAMAVEKIEDLGEAIAKGGVPMQQAVAAMLAQAGQYIRRERSFAGVNYDTVPVPVNTEQYAGISRSMAAINHFSHLVKVAVDAKAGELAAEGQVFGHDTATGDAGVHSINFTSIMHNIINQMLLSMKAEPAAKMAIEAIKAGHKPVLTVAGTLETFLKDTADNLGMKAGDALKSDFRDILFKYLDRTRTVTIKPPFEDQEPIKHVLTDDELGAEGVGAYKAAKDMIRALDLASLPVSPIDYMKNILQKAGYKVGEITGRGMTLDYSGKHPVISSRPGKELSIAGRNQTIADFNNGPNDALVLNQAGATGLSAHAGVKFKDQRPRRMFIVQPEGNIDTHMQMLGRIHRTGQVVLPSYAQLVADIPAEKRPAAVLSKKMASLNANTTAARGSAMTAKDVPDFMNEYGDRVAASFATDNPEIHWQMGAPVKFDETGTPKLDNAMHKLTGRVMLLAPDKQEELYDHLEGEYAALLEQMNAAGENALEAKTLDLKAKTFERTEVVAPRNDSGSPFAAPVIAEKAKVARLGKPYKPEEVVQKIVDEINSNAKVTAENAAEVLANINNTRANTMSDLARRVHEKRHKTAIEGFNDYKRGVLDNIADPDRIEKERTKLDAVKDRWTTIDDMMRPGARLYLKTSNGNVTGVLVKVEQKGQPRNPLAMSTWKATFAVPDASRQLTIPYSRIYENGKSPEDDPLTIEAAPLQEWQETPKATLDRFDHMQSEAKEDRYILTGNMLAAYDWMGKKGQIVHFTDDKGNARQGILTARDWNLADHAKTRPRVLRTPNEVVDWLRGNKGQTLFATDNVTYLKSDPYSPNYYYINVESKKSTGGVFYLDKQLTDMLGDFYRRSGMYTVGFEDKDNLIFRVVGRMQELGAKFGVPAEIPKTQKVGGEGVAMAMARRGQTQTPEFKRWFGDSKVTENGKAGGKPLVVYHGTDASFAEFKHGDGWYGRGSYFTDNPKFASEFAEEYAAGEDHERPNVMPVYLSIKRPFVFNEELNGEASNVQLMKQLGFSEKKINAAFGRHLGDDRTPQLIREKLEAAGHDGIVVLGFGGNNEYIAFHPEQIKSATGNSGAFDPDNPSIVAEGRPQSRLTVEAQKRRDEIIAGVRAIVKRMLGDRADVVFRNQIPAGGPVGWGEHGGATLGGQYFPEFDLIEVALHDPSFPNQTETANHEAWHAVEDHFLTEQEMGLLKREEPRLREAAARFMGMKPEDMADIADFEIRAIAFSAYAHDRDNGGRGAGLHIGVRAIFEKLLRLFRAIRDYLRGLGVNKTNDIFEQAYEGKLAERPSRKADEGLPSRVAEAAQAHRESTASPSVGMAMSADFGRAATARADKLRRAYGRLAERVADMLGSETAIRMKEGFSDYSHRMKLLQNDVEALRHDWVAADGTLPDAQQFYTLKRLFPGKRAALADEFERQHFTPLQKFMRDQGVTLQDAGDYLYARHAIERNMEKGPLYPADHQFNQAMRDRDTVGASGMSRRQAEDIRRKYETGPKAAAFRELARRVADIRTWTQDQIVRSGLESIDTIRKWNETYADYVPLKEWDDPADMPEGAQAGRGIGRGDIRGKEAKYAFGRRSKSDNPLVHLINDAYRALTRAERNRVLKSLAAALSQLNAAMRTAGEAGGIAKELGIRLNRGRPVPEIDRLTGLVRWREDPRDQFGDNAVKFKVNGQPRYIVFDDPAMANAVRTWSPTALPGPLNLILWLTNKMKSMWTHYNPAFLVRHNARYFVEGLLNAFELKETGNYSPVQYAKEGFPLIGKATRAIFAVEKGLSPGDPAVDGELRQLMADYALMKQHGGVMAMRMMRDIDQINDDLRIRLNELGRSKRDPIRIWQDGVRAMNHVSSVWDNAQRLATFSQALKQGMSPQQAALKARDATIDYQFRGLWSNIMGLWEPFFNTALRTGFRLGGAVSRSKVMRRVFLGTMAMGLAASAWNYLIGGKDKDGVPFFDKIPHWEKSKGFILLVPWIPDEKGRPTAVKFPFPYNWAAPLAFGYAAGNFMWGSAKAGETLKDLIIKPFLSTFSQIGEEGLGFRSLVPEMLRPGYDIARNADWTDRPVHIDKAYQRGPNAWSGKKDIGGRVRTGEGWKDVAKFINGVSGGSRVKSGAFDFYPEDIREIFNPFIGQQVRLGDEAKETAKSVAQGKVPDPHHVPMLSVFMGQDYDSADRASLYERTDKQKHPWLH